MSMPLQEMDVQGCHLVRKTHISAIFAQDYAPDAVRMPDELADALVSRSRVPQSDHALRRTSRQDFACGV